MLSLSPRRKRRAQTLSRIDAKSFAVTGFPVPVPPAELQAYDIDIVKAAWSLDGATLVASLVYQRRGIHGDLAPGGRGNLPKWHHSLFALECDSETGLAKPGASWVHRSFAADVGARRFVILENRVVTPRSGAFALPSLEPVEMPKPSGVRTSGLAMRGDVTARITQRSDPKQRIVIAKGDASVELSETDAKPSARILDDSPKISADASWVAYQTTSIGDPYRTIWTCFFETNGGRHLHEAIDAHRVAWSPDGRRVAFTSGNGKLRLLDWPALLAEFP